MLSNGATYFYVNFGHEIAHQAKRTLVFGLIIYWHVELLTW